MIRDARQKTPAQKAKTAAARVERAASRRRVKQWTHAAQAASSANYPLNIALTITWKNLQEGYRRHGHIQNMDETKREKRLWAELRMVAARAGIKFIAGRAPEHDKTRGLHLHLTIHLPNNRAITDAIETVGRVTGAPAVWCNMRGRCLRSSGRTTRGVVAISACGSWFLQRDDPSGNGSSVHLLAYTAKGYGKSKVEGQHRLSNDLATLTRQWKSETTITARAA